MRFRDRKEAGRRLAERLTHLRDEHPVVVGLPRGGVPVAAEIARSLDATLDIVLVRKVGAPNRPELAAGAVGEDGVTVQNRSVLRELGLTWEDMSTQVNREREEVRRRATTLRPARPRADLRGRTVIVVDDGIATGSTVVAAVRVVRDLGAARIVLAVPVAPADAVQRLAALVDELVCVHAPARFLAVGQWFQDFKQVSDDEVRRFLAAAQTDADELVTVRLNGHTLLGHLAVPPQATGMVIFAHGSGSGRHSPRNRSVAGVLNASGLGTLLIDLLDRAEAEERGNVFDIDLLASRLAAATAVVRTDPRLAGLPIGFFGASTGAAAALCAATATDAKVLAVVSRGGRPDLADRCLAMVEVPTLLIVGDLDEQVLRVNEAARQRMRCPTELVVVPGAGHLFTEPGALEAVAQLARRWFERHLTPNAGDL